MCEVVRELSKEDFLRVHAPELLTPEGKKYYAYLDFPEKQLDLVCFWQRAVQKIFFYYAHSALVSFSLLFETLSVDGFEPLILPLVLADMSRKEEVGVLLANDFADLLIETGSLFTARRHLLHWEIEDISPRASIVCYELLESRMRAAESEVSRRFSERSFLNEDELASAVRSAGAASAAEAAVLRALLLVTTPIQIYNWHYYNSDVFAEGDEVGRCFIVFALQKAIAAGESALNSTSDQSSIRKALAYDRLVHEFASSAQDFSSLLEFQRSVDFLRLKAASLTGLEHASA